MFYDTFVWPWNNYWHKGVFSHNSGKTEASAAKCAKFVLRDQAPPRRDTPFWILSDTMDVVTSVCWGEKLLGNGHIPPCEVEWDRISWHDKKKGQPTSVPLKPWPRSRGGHYDKNWVLTFKSYDQGRKAMQARSIGGFWFSEQFPVSIFTEVMVRCRDFLFPGGQFCEFTPIEPDLCLWIEKLLEEPPNGWKFYRCNTEMNTALANGAVDAFMATVSDEMKETRLRGALATFEGAIYPRFHPTLHVVDDDEASDIPDGCYHVLGVDWGASVEHPFVVVWACVDGAGDWLVYDEYWSIDQDKTVLQHAEEVTERCRIWDWPSRLRRHKDLAREIRLLDGDVWHGMAYADPSRPGNISEFGQYGVPTTQACNDVYQGIDVIRALLKVDPKTGKPRLRIAKRCKHLIDEMRKYRWRRARKSTEAVLLNPAVAKPEPLKRDDDTVDAMRYAIVSTMKQRLAGEAIGTLKTAPPDTTLTRTSGQRLPSGLMPTRFGR